MVLVSWTQARGALRYGVVLSVRRLYGAMSEYKSHAGRGPDRRSRFLHIGLIDLWPPRERLSLHTSLLAEVSFARAMYFGIASLVTVPGPPASAYRKPIDINFGRSL